MSPPRTLVYAMGGGLGHLTRVRAFFATNEVLRRDLPIDDSGRFAVAPEHAPLVLSASPHLSAVADQLGARALSPPSALNQDRGAFAVWLRQALRDHGIERVIVDAFPRGILGELDADVVDGLDAWHLARRLRFSRYQQRGDADGAVPFARTFTVEPLQDDHAAWLAQTSAVMTATTLIDPPTPSPPAVDALLEGGPFTLVVHAGVDGERDALRARAHIAIADGRAPPRLVEVFADGAARPLLYPTTALWAAAEHVVSGAGFNAMRHGASRGDAHDAVAFDRALDDQHWRLAWSRRHRGAATDVVDDGVSA